MKTVIVTAALIIEQDRVFITQRMENSSYGLLWEFPGGKVMEGEEPREALRRELKEELGSEANVGPFFDAIYTFAPQYPILLILYHCWIEKQSLKPIGCRDFRWVTLKELEKLSMPPADDSIRQHLAFLYGKDSVGISPGPD